MKLIAHRGNVDGIQREYENSPDYIDYALNLGVDCEVDIWLHTDNKFYLGHDNPQHPITLKWIEKNHNKLWLHCKNIEALVLLKEFDPTSSYLHYFWHENDKLTLTSRGYIWVYPGNQKIPGSIAVLPELNNDDVSDCFGVCTDNVFKYQNK